MEAPSKARSAQRVRYSQQKSAAHLCVEAQVGRSGARGGESQRQSVARA
jgi:hypothetical protein